MSYLAELDATPAAERWRRVRDWMASSPLALYPELRQYRPVLELPEVTLVTRFHDCVEVLRRHDAFGVDLYAPKQGDYWMAQDDTPAHWREKSIMRAILDREDIPKIRDYVAAKAGALLDQAGGSIDAVGGLGRAVPIALVQDWFGFADSDPAQLVEWSYWNQMDAFHNQPFDAILRPDPAAIVAHRERVNEAMRDYIVALVRRRVGELQAGASDLPDDPVVRLVKLSFGGALRFDVARVVLNVGGLLIGAVETTSHAMVNALAGLLDRPDVLARARNAAEGGEPAEVDGFAFEALRFRPAFPYFFRTCHRPMTLAGGTDHATTVQPGTTVLAVTHAAMHDAGVIADPDRFDPGRAPSDMFHFGLGLHECLGRPIASVMIPEIVRQCLRRPGLRAAGPVDYDGGPVPERFPIAWQT